MSEIKKIKWLIKKELLSLKRHPSRLISILTFPIIMILLFGYGMGGDLTNLPIVVVYHDNGDLTDLTLDTIKSSEIYNVVNITNNVNYGKEMVNNGKVKAAIILPYDYNNLNSGQQKSVTLYIDSSDQMASQVIIPATQGIFNKISQIETTIQTESISPPISTSPTSTSPTSTFNSSNQPPITESLNNLKTGISLQINKIYGNIKYIDFLVPAVLGMTIMMSCMMGMGASIAGERETGELARLFMTPTSVSTVIGGKIIGKLCVEIIRALILLFAAILIFNVTIKGGILPTIIVLSIGALCFIGFGIMLSARAQNQEDYIQIAMPFSIPMMFVSGVFYPIETMPWIFQKIAYLFPLTYLNNAMRGIMIKGQTLGDVWLDLVILLGFTLFFFLIGVKRFNRDI